MAVSLYRKYRPEVFSDVVGQQHVIGTLLNAVKSNNVAHAYLFCGPRGTGKTTTARLLAKALMCDNVKDGAPCGECESCIEIANASFPDVYELDAASRTGVENVREEIISRVNFAPTRGKCKIYIIDEVHMLSTAAFNALLKTLEEPPAHVYFVLCTTDPHKVIETIQSRCQRFDFHRFSIEEIVSYLRRICDAEGVAAETEALQALAIKSNGGMRDATTALEQTIIACDNKVTLAAVHEQFGQGETASGNGLFDLSAYIAQGDVKNVFLQLADMATAGIDFKIFAGELALHMRNIYVAALTNADSRALECPKSDLSKYKQQLSLFGNAERIASILSECGELIKDLRAATDARLTTEIALMRMCGHGVAVVSMPDVSVVQASDTVSAHGSQNQASQGSVGQAGPDQTKKSYEATVQGTAQRAAKKQTNQPAAHADFSSHVAQGSAPTSIPVAAQTNTASAAEPMNDGAPAIAQAPNTAPSQTFNATSAQVRITQTPATQEKPAVRSQYAPPQTQNTPQVSASVAQSPASVPQVTSTVPAPQAEQSPQAAQAAPEVPVSQATQAASTQNHNAASAQVATSQTFAQTPAPQDSAFSQTAASATHPSPANPNASQRTDQTPAAKSTMSLPRLQAAFVTTVKRYDLPTGTLLDGITLKEAEGMYIVVWPNDKNFAMTLAKSPDASRIINSAFREVLGAPAELVFKLEGDAFPTTSTPGKPPRGAHAIKHSNNVASGAQNKPAIPENMDTKIDAQVDKEMANMLSAFGEGIQIEEIKE